jgi:predicted nuclease of predicted toxin-antitoxin system
VKIVADENVDQQIVDRLRAAGHEVLFVAELDPGIDDEAVLLRSRQTNAILLTADKDFGELVFRQRLVHAGVLLIRLAGLTPDVKAALGAAAAEHKLSPSGNSPLSYPAFTTAIRCPTGGSAGKSVYGVL